MYDGKLAEMQTGEGKTLAVVFPAALRGMPGGGVHVLTYNDYPAARDADWMAPIYQFLGLTVGSAGPVHVRLYDENAASGTVLAARNLTGTANNDCRSHKSPMTPLISPGGSIDTT